MPAWAPTLAAVALFAILITGLSGLWLAHASRDRLWRIAGHARCTLAAPPGPMLFHGSTHGQTWFAGKLPSPSICRTANSGYILLAQACYLDGKPAAQLVYGLGKHEISVFVFESGLQAGLARFLEDDKTSMREKGFTVERWNEAGLSYVFISDANAPDVVRCLR